MSDQPDYWFRYEMKGGEEVLNMSENLASIAGDRVFEALETIKACMTPAKYRAMGDPKKCFVCESCKALLEDDIYRGLPNDNQGAFWCPTSESHVHDWRPL